MSFPTPSARTRHDPEPWVAVDDVAMHLGVVKDSIYRWIEHRGLPAQRVGRLWKCKLSEVDAADYDAILVPGGLGPMVDVARNPAVQRAVVRSWSTGKFVTAVCHGPCSLLGVDLGDGVPFVRGKKLTAFSKKEEYDYARDDVPYELEDALRAEGADYSSAENWQPKVVVDGRLMTGQNPASAGPMAKELVAALKKLA